MKVDAILTADIHTRADTPVCRTDDFMVAQTKKLSYIRDLAIMNDCPILIAGDIFDHSNVKASPFLEGILLKYFFHLRVRIIAIPGQHDLGDNSMKNYIYSSLSVMENAGKITVCKEHANYVAMGNAIVTGFPFGHKIQKREGLPEAFSSFTKIALAHQMVHEKKSIHEEVKSTSALSLLKNNNYDLIISGDNHKPFQVKYEGKLLVNCGSMMRTRADQVDYTPAVWLWNRESNTVTPHYLPIQKGVVNRDHVDEKVAREARYTSHFGSSVSNVKGEQDVSHDFKDNMDIYLDEKNIRKGVREAIYQAYGGE